MTNLRILVVIAMAWLGSVPAWAGGPTATWTMTASPTPTTTLSPTQTPTVTATVSTTATITSTATVTPTVTVTQTGTINTPTCTSSPTATPTVTLTNTVTSTPTVTSTATTTSTPGISRFQIEPKTLSGSVTLRWEFTADMLHLQLKVFTSSFRMLKRFSLDAKTHADLYKLGAHELAWDGLDDRGRHLIPGRYYLFLSAEKGKLKFTAEDQVDQP